jgi:hypothetical protein
LPKRIQLRRTKGWRKPEGAIVVSRPSQWGNPFPTADLFRSWLTGYMTHWYPERREVLIWSMQVLNGHDLACWCPLDKPCHADVLLEMANGK